MIRRILLGVVCALALSGCDGWTANRQLIPEEQRDNIGLSGAYESSESYLDITPLGGNAYRIEAQAIGAEEVEELAGVAFDLIRSERNGDDQDGYAYENTYLMEVPRRDDQGKITYAYEIVRSTYTDQDRNPTFTQFKVACSRAAQAIATGDEDGCVFADYAEVRTAALDALAWAEDARMQLQREQFFPRAP